MRTKNIWVAMVNICYTAGDWFPTKVHCNGWDNPFWTTGRLLSAIVRPWRQELLQDMAPTWDGAPLPTHWCNQSNSRDSMRFRPAEHIDTPQRLPPHRSDAMAISKTTWRYTKQITHHKWYSSHGHPIRTQPAIMTWCFKVLRFGIHLASQTYLSTFGMPK